MPGHATDMSTVAPKGSAGTLVFATLVLYAAFGEVATGLLGPAMPTLGAVFDKAPATVQLTIAAFAVMFAVGQLFFGPFSDRHGRRIALLFGSILTLVGSLAAGLADSIWMIILGRAIQGLGAASGYVVSRAIVRDIYGADGAAKAMAMLFALMAASFLSAPLVGGILLDLAGWRAGFVVASALAVLWLVSTIVIMPETRVAAPASEAQAIRRIYLGLFRNRGFLGFMITHSIGYAGLVCFVAGAPYLFIESMDVKPATYGGLAALAMSGALIGSTTARYASPRWGMQRVILASLMIMVCAPAILVGMGLLGSLPAWLIVAIEFAYWFGGGLMAPNTAAGVVISHPKAAGAAAAVLGFVQQCAGAAVAAMQGLIFDGSVFPMVGMQALLGLAALVVWHRLGRQAPRGTTGAAAG